MQNDFKSSKLIAFLCTSLCSLPLSLSHMHARTTRQCFAFILYSMCDNLLTVNRFCFFVVVVSNHKQKSQQHWSVNHFAELSAVHCWASRWIHTHIVWKAKSASKLRIYNLELDGDCQRTLRRRSILTSLRIYFNSFCIHLLPQSLYPTLQYPQYRCQMRMRQQSLYIQCPGLFCDHKNTDSNILCRIHS